MHLIHPTIRLKANVEAGCKEEAGVPVVDDHDVEDDLRHPEHIWESRSRFRSFEEGEHSVDSENSIQPQGHRAGHLVDANMKIVLRFGNCSSLQHQHHQPIPSGSEDDLLMASNASV